METILYNANKKNGNFAPLQQQQQTTTNQTNQNF